MAKRLPRELRIVEGHNPCVVRSRYEFSYQSLDEPKLARLRRRYRLRSVVRRAESEFEEFLLLRDWVKSRWAHGWDEAKATDILDGMALLEDAKKGMEFACGTYAILFVQCVLSLGHQARRISISKRESDFIPPDEGNVGHVVAEVWSNDWDKWVLMDPDMNCHYEHRGTPLSACEIRSHWLQGRWREVHMVRGESQFVTSNRPPEIWAKEGMERVRREFRKFLRYNAMDYYHYVSVEMGNDYLSSKKGRYHLSWADELSPPRLVRCNVPVKDAYTENLSDLYWRLDNVHIELRCDGGDGSRPSSKLAVSLESAMPNLDHLLVKIDDGRWRRRPDRFVWRLKKGDNTISARSVNRLGVEGPETTVTVRYCSALP